MDELRKEAQETWPAGKSDIEKYGSGEIETFTTPNFSAGLAYRGQWIFIATDTGLLKATLDRFEGQRDPNSLAELPAFKKSAGASTARRRTTCCSCGRRCWRTRRPRWR